MKKILAACIAPIALAAVPAAAQSLADTHEMRWAPTGKVPVAHHHPLKKSCRPAATPHHQAGKGPLIAGTPAQRGCDREIAEAGRNGSEHAQAARR